MDEIQTPNLEALDADELRQCEVVFARLASICEHLKNARRARVDGRITEAIREEGLADDQYQQLPAHCRW